MTEMSEFVMCSLSIKGGNKTSMKVGSLRKKIMAMFEQQCELYLTLLNCTLKMAKVVNFMLMCILAQLKKFFLILKIISKSLPGFPRLVMNEDSEAYLLIISAG